nr:cadherin-8 [Salvelinus alpinus]
MPKRSEEMLTDVWTSLLLVWITCVPYTSMTPIISQSKSLQTGSTAILRGLVEGQRILSRAKRGWVWNQMFVLEEFSGPDPILVGRLHTDLDVGSTPIKYVLAGEGAGTIFAINEITGDIHAMKRLDREEKAEYTLTAQVTNRDTDQPLEPPSEFIIKVQDINDNPPQFVEGPYRASVPEMSQVGTSVTRVTATDADDPVYGNSAKLVYSILEGQPYFSIDPNTAIIKIALHGMDREMREEYLVVIQAKDMGGHMGGLSGTTTVTVTLTDVNDNPPKFSKSLYEFVIPEELGIGKPGGKVKANDRDIGENAKSTYNIIDGDEKDVFEIITDAQTQEGILRLKKPLNFETKKSYTLKVEAANIRFDPNSGAPFKDTATVKIAVEDSDEPPVFSKPTFVLQVDENAPINTVIGTVTARDPDVTGSLVRYFIDRHTDLERQFNINVDDGKITLAKPLDRETDVWHNITVTATEIRNHSQISRAIVAIRVLDINDNAPEFATEYEAFLCENGKPGQVIQTVSAVDKDDPIQGHYFEYRLIPEMLNNPNFTIKNNGDNSISVLAKHDTFRRQKQEMYFLPIIVTDNGNPPMSSTNTLTIRVCGCSREGIVQSCNVEAYVLPIGLSMGALIAILACIILLLVIVVLFVTLRRHKNKPLIIKDDEDVRENIIRYDDEGGGEEDTEAFDIATLQNPDGINGYLPRKDIKPDLQFMPRQSGGPNGVDVDEFINVRLHEADNDPTAPPYDSIQIYGYEGRGSIAGSLSSLETASSDSDQNYDYLREWGPRFRRLGELYSVGESDKETYFIDRHTDLERQFNINVDDGKITLAKPLDRETDVWHNITVTATEIRNHSQISRAIVAIRVLDINDNAPEFATEYEAFLCENGKPGQVIQTVSAVDKDDPIQGHYFEYRLIPEMLNNPNFTIKNNGDNSISVLAKHDTFRRQKQEMYFLPIIVTDNGNPPMSSTNTLTIRVCGCSREGIVQSCNVEAYVLPIGLSMGALIAILACIILLLVIVVLFVTLRRHKNKPLIIKDDEDVRENIIRYDDEGGGEEDTEAFDIATLQNPDGINGYLPRKDIKPDLQFMPRQSGGPNGVDVDEFINVRLHEADNDPTAPPYDSIQIYGYEGRGSIAGSLSSLETASSDSDQNYDYLREWGPRFRRLGELYSVGESDKET